MSRFEDRLFAEIVEQHGALLAGPPGGSLAAPATVRRGVRLTMPARRLVPAGAAALALAIALLALVVGFGSGGGGAPAYAVVSNADGTVTVTLRELAGVTGADEALHTLGVHARVVRSESGCTTQPSAYRHAHLTPEQSQRIVSGAPSGGEASVVIAPSAIPTGDTVLIGARRLGAQTGRSAIGLEIGIYEGATPSCLPAAGTR